MFFFSDNTVILRKGSNNNSDVTIPQLIAKAQIVILGQAFLDWVYTHPLSSIGNLFKDSTRVIGLLLGITKDHVKAEHRAELLTFAVWKFMLTVKPNDHEQLANSLVKAVSSMMPNQHLPYVMPRPMRKFKVWPQPVQDKVLLMLNDKISRTVDKIEVSIEIFSADKLETKIVLESKDVQVVNEMAIEVEIPRVIKGSSAKFKLEISKFCIVLNDLLFRLFGSFSNTFYFLESVGKLTVTRLESLHL